MLFKLLVLEMTFVDIMSGLLVKVRAVDCVVKQLMCVYFLDLSILVLLKHAVDFCKPEWQQFSVLVAKFTQISCGIGHQMTAKVLVGRQSELQIFDNFGHPVGNVELFN